MPINNQSGAFNTGRDITVMVMAPGGGIVTIPNITDFDVNQVTADVKSDLLTGVQLNAALPKGWSGSISFDRGSADVDNLIASIEAAWLNNGSYTATSIYTVISETSGAQTTWQYSNVSLKLSSGGSWKGDSTVKCKLDFMANSRVSV